MRPVLALELSADGIELHELSYDGKWRRLSYAALTDPFLPKKMAAMRGVAKASQGRFFKSQLWIPADQVHQVTAKIESDEVEDRKVEAAALLQEMPEYANGNYTVEVSENDSFGNANIAFIDNSIMAEAKRFAKGYGFGIEDVTSAQRLNGFREQPFFHGNGGNPVKAPIKVDFRKVGFFGLLAAAVVGITAGGYWLYRTVDFSSDPSTAIEATEGRVLDATEDPRAPIRPTTLSEVTATPAPSAIDSGAALAPLPDVETAAAEFDTQVAQNPMDSDLGNAEPPVPAAPQSAPDISQTSPDTPSGPLPDSLPAPESNGFPLVAAALPPVSGESPASGFSGQRIARYAPERNAGEFSLTPRRNDVLPNGNSTISLATQMSKYNDSMGLTQVQANNAAALRQAAALEAQKIPPVVVSGRPDILPVLRGGSKVPDRQPEPVLPVEQPPENPVLDEAAIAALQHLPPKVVTGLPEITPFLRSGTNIADLPPDPVAEPPAQTVENPQPLGPEAEAARIAILQAAPPIVVNNRPDWVLSLRGGVDIPQSATPAPETPAETVSEAARLHPLARPDSIAITSLINDPSLSEVAVTNSTAPARRADDFATKVEGMMASFAETLRTTPQFTDTPREVNLPTQANVAREATIEDGINLRDVSLIGVYGKPGSYSALIRSGRGKYTMVKVGDTYDRWKVVAITENTVRLQKGSKTKVLRLPG